MAGQHAARRCLRDELFLLAHDEHDRWRPRVSTRSLAVGLAGAALVDLLLTGNLRADSGHVTARSRYVRHGLDPICARIVADLAMTSAWIPVREAVIGTAADLYEYTLIHLITTDLITAQGRRLGRGFRYRPADSADVGNARYHPRRRVQTLGQGTTRPVPATDALCALIRALRIEAALHLELPGNELRTRLATITAQYRANHPDPWLVATPDLISAVEAALGNASTQRHPAPS